MHIDRAVSFNVVLVDVIHNSGKSEISDHVGPVNSFLRRPLHPRVLNVGVGLV